MKRSMFERVLAEFEAAKLRDQCWEWPGQKTKGGYGIVKVGKRRRVVHRMAYEAKHGEIPDEILVCHKCDNPPCLNVDHLFLGTPKDNMDDKVAKGRQYQIVSEEQCLAIRLDGRPRKEISMEYSISVHTVLEIQQGRHHYAKFAGTPAIERRSGYPSKLTSNDVRRIRLDERPAAIAAPEYGISRSVFGSVKRRKSFGWVLD